MTNKSKNSDSQQEFKVPPAFKFQEGERVLCFHGPLIYEAKCLQARYADEEKTNKYHIHYSGWNKSWDEWVPESRVLKHNDGNIQRQKELHKAQNAEPKGKKGKKRSVSGKEKDCESREKDADDSRSSTPVNEKSGGKASASATQSSSQESASDIPKRKRSKLDPSVETSDGKSFKKGPLITASSWKVNLYGTNHLKPSPPGGQTKTPGSPGDRNRSSTKKESTPKKTPKSAALSESLVKIRSPTKSIVESSTTRTNTRISVSPTKYPGMNGKKLRVSIVKLDLKEWDNTNEDHEKTRIITPNLSGLELQDFGELVVRKLDSISDKARRNELKTKIIDLFRSEEKKKSK